jgi:hypothetical protein
MRRPPVDHVAARLGHVHVVIAQQVQLIENE